MKIKSSDFEAMKQAIEPILIAHPNAAKKYQDAGLSPKRFRWDVVRAARYDVCQLYSYLNDDHIDTALRAIVDKFVNGQEGK